MTSRGGLNVLVVGSGAREHAIVWKLLQSPKVREVYAAPGNAGTGLIARNLPIPASDIGGLRRGAFEHSIDLTLVGPEIPLAAGIVDEFNHAHLPIFGPTAAAARIESSKAYAKDLMHRYAIPCARSQSFDDFDAAMDYLYRTGAPVAIKADGLAAGKGVVVCQTFEEAQDAIDAAMRRMVFGAAGRRVVVEEFMEGREVSLLAFCDGETVRPMEPASDYKRAFDGDLGPNTGGVGSFSPPPYFGPDLVREAQATILEPAVRAMKKEGSPFVGVLYAGLMLTDQGMRVVEFNARFGDPEAQAILPRLKTDFVDVIQACMDGRLSSLELQWDEQPCVGVVMTSGGYPEQFQTGYPITGLDLMDDGVRVFHAGTTSRPMVSNTGLRRFWATDLPSPGVDALLSGDIVTAGGRVLTVVAMGPTVAAARATAYRNVGRIRFEGAQYRSDIALPAPEPEPAPGGGLADPALPSGR